MRSFTAAALIAATASLITTTFGIQLTEDAHYPPLSGEELICVWEEWGADVLYQESEPLRVLR